MIYIAEARESAAFMLEWEAWKAMGVKLFPVYTCNPDPDADSGSNGNGVGPMVTELDRCGISIHSQM